MTLDFLELTGTGDAIRALRQRTVRPHVTLAPPRIRKPGEEKIDRYLAGLEPDAILVRGLGALHETTNDGIPRIGDFSLNVTNAITASEVLSRGLAAFTPSFDLDAGQLATLLTPAYAPFAEVVVHHPMPLFHMEHCVIAALLSEGKDHRTCGRPCDRHRVSLRDRAGLDHPVEADVGCRNTVFHAAPQSAAHLVATVRDRGASVSHRAGAGVGGRRRANRPRVPRVARRGHDAARSVANAEGRRALRGREGVAAGRAGLRGSSTNLGP